jgi:hypothetical protein
MANDFSGRVYASIVDDTSVTGERTAEAFMMLSFETFAKVTIDPETRFDNKFFRTLLGRMGTEVRTVPTDAHWASHAEKPVHLLRVACTKIAARHAKISPEAVLALAVRSVKSMKTSTGLSRLEIDCGRPARHPPLSEELFALSPPVLPASAHEIEEFMSAADDKRQLHQVMRARQRLNASLCGQVSGRPPALRNGDSFLYWRTSVMRSQSGWRGPAIVNAQQRNMVIGFTGGIVVLCHRTRARLFERSFRDEKPSPLLDDDAYLTFQGKGVDSSASSALTAQDADDSVQSPFVTEFMPVEFEDVEFRDVSETGRHLGVCSDDPEQAARVARASAAGPASNLSQLMNTASVGDTVPDVSPSTAETVTAVEHMDDDDDDDDRPPGEVLSSDSPHALEPFHSAPGHASQ